MEPNQFRLLRIFNEPSASYHYIGSTSTITNSITTAIYLAKTVHQTQRLILSHPVWHERWQVLLSSSERWENWSGKSLVNLHRVTQTASGKHPVLRMLHFTSKDTKAQKEQKKVDLPEPSQDMSFLLYHITSHPTFCFSALPKVWGEEIKIMSERVLHCYGRFPPYKEACVTRSEGPPQIWTSGLMQHYLVTSMLPINHWPLNQHKVTLV